MKNIKEKLNNYKFIILIIIIIGALFYWFQVRPILIKRQCSWFTQLESGKPAVPAFAGITKEEAKQKTAQYLKENNCTSYDTKFRSYSYNMQNFTCSIYFSEEPARPAQSAEPDKLVTKDATQKQYDVCLRHHGL